MNKRKSTMIVLLTVIGLALLLAGSAAAKVSDVTFECPDAPYGTTAPGTMTFPNGNIHIRGMQQEGRIVCSDIRQVGTNKITVNANWNGDFHGPMWGTFRFESDEGGVWTGTWNGQMTENGSWYNAVGNGQGIYAGQKIWIDKRYDVSTTRILAP